MFEASRELLERYYCKQRSAGISKTAEHLLHEVRGRLRQLEWLHARLVWLDKELEAEARSANPPRPGLAANYKLVFVDAGDLDCTDFSGARVPFQKSDELRILLEAFYYSAHRVRDIFRDGVDELPDLGGFDPKGVRDVRNHLIEHPSGKAGVVVFSVAAAGPVGPQLKPVRWSQDPPGSTDKGLHENARELKEELERVLSGALGFMGNQGA